jgi:hypothetical protein
MKEKMGRKGINKEWEETTNSLCVCVYYDLIDYFFIVPQVIVCLRKDRVARTAPVSITNVTVTTVTEDADVQLQVSRRRRRLFIVIIKQTELLAQFFNCFFYCENR